MGKGFIIGQVARVMFRGAIMTSSDEEFAVTVELLARVVPRLASEGRLFSREDLAQLPTIELQLNRSLCQEG